MSRLRWPDSTNSVSDVPGTIHHEGWRSGARARPLAFRLLASDAARREAACTPRRRADKRQSTARRRCRALPPSTGHLKAAGRRPMITESLPEGRERAPWPVPTCPLDSRSRRPHQRVTAWIRGKRSRPTSSATCAPFNAGNRTKACRCTATSTAGRARSTRSVPRSTFGGTTAEPTLKRRHSSRPRQRPANGSRGQPQRPALGWL